MVLVTLATAALGCASSEESESRPTDAVAEPSLWQLGPVSVTEQPGSLWHLAEEDDVVVARHVERDLALLIDPTNAEEDERYSGIYVVEAGQPRFAGTYYGSSCSMFVPDRPHENQSAVSVTAAGETLSVEMTEGSLSEMVDANYESDEPFRWTSTWSLSAQGLRMLGSGLYYLLVPKDACEVTVLGAGGAPLGSVSIAADTSPFLRYFDEVRTIELGSALLGELSVSTDAARLQVEVPSYPSTTLFELDFDHSFKDRGQLDVHVELELPLSR